MNAALGLPFALALGVVASLVSGVVRRIGRRERSWWPDMRGIGRDVRVLRRGGKERATALEIGGALASFLGAGIAAGSALGEARGSGTLVYLALLAGAAGAHIAALDASTPLRGEAVARARGAWAAAEPGFLVALGGALGRWRAEDLEAVRGAQEVLGYGPQVGPPVAAAGLVAAVVLFVATGALRLLPPSEAVRATGRRAGGALLIALCRWSLAGATALVAAALLVGAELRGPETTPDRLLLAGAVAVGAALLLGVVDGLASVFWRRRVVIGLGALVLAGGAAAAAVLG